MKEIPLDLPKYVDLNLGYAYYLASFCCKYYINPSSYTSESFLSFELLSKFKNKKKIKKVT